MAKIIKHSDELILLEEDLVMLKRELPHSPCEECSIRGTGECCGCPEQMQWYKKTEPYRNSNIYDVAVVLRDLRDAERAEIEMHKKVVRYRNNLLELVGEKAYNDILFPDFKQVEDLEFRLNSKGDN